MDDKKRAQFDKEFEKLKKKAERKERKNALYKPVTTLYFEKALYNSLRALEIRFEKKFATDEELKEIENKIDGLHNKFDILFEKLDWFTGKYTKLEEEQTIIGSKVVDHGERIETMEKKVGIYAS
ncbi:MAG: hypothetical protein UW22_C0002G0034 [Candidatus Gottesmanbacteria bacterium GW2011_GWB1_44_11c]|uniref:Uncharacterized protein n=2 Tax=Candidatus Gottesmaniibacteriota TaxID=1752720 RepID=A0A0G1IQT6_9BACT|nr:MAG: hypothetical protein UW22_C0002G0034 [Candidatus Gottesmanbacteria bacterium GW2011_GWB1_44_11c]KKT61520.1 MAG: hypothetical protein UW52_C0002G0034 [Candidatus Gottesmanbacteria bacterium GW2011_GWA1_44_24b]